MTVRFAEKNELEQVNLLRREVNDLHVQGKPEVFKPGFDAALRDYIYVIWDDPNKKIVVAQENGEIRGFAVLNHIVKPETPYMYERDFLDIDELAVGERHRRQGVASALIAFIRDYAREQGYKRIELNMWEFNQSALEFYEAAGFSTFRRYMEMFI